MERGDNNGIRIKILMGIAAVVFAAAAAAGAVILRPSENRVVEVVQDGEVLYTIDLDAGEDGRIVVPYAKGGGNPDSSNTITIEGGAIWVSEAECPDQTCVKMGKLRSESLPIICLPNHLIIRFAE